jgi:hypothetical protein
MWRVHDRSEGEAQMQKPMKSVAVRALLGLTLFGLTNAGAAVVAAPNVTIGAQSYRTFKDTNTGLTWLALDNFFDSTSTYNNVVSRLTGSGFHLATLSDVQALEASMPAVPANFASQVVIVGGNYPGSPHASGTRSLMWGIYEDGNPGDGISYAYRFDTDSIWNLGANAVTSSQTLRSGNADDQDLGAFVVSNSATTSVPALSDYAITALALMLMAGGAFFLRRRFAMAPDSL